MTGSWVIRATLNLNAATCFVLLYVPLPELRSMVPDLLTLVETSLQPSDPRRRDVERIARNILTASPSDVDRRRLATAVRAAYSFQETQIIRLRSFRNIILGTAAAMAAIALGIAVVALFRPDLMPLCFPTPESVVCPTGAHALPAGSAAGQSVTAS